MPPGVSAWFAGTANVESAGWHALLGCEEPKLMRWWAEWHGANPEARPPTDAPWITWR
jgi:hypothetical protein